MSWSYDSTNLNTTTPSGRINVVRFIIGDTDTNDQQADNEEILFALSQVNNNIYLAGAWVSRSLGGKYSRQVNLNLDDQISAEYGELSAHYYRLADQLEYQGRLNSGVTMKAGGISKTTMEVNRQLTDRVKPRIRRDQFNNPPDESSNYYTGDDD